MSKHRIAHDDLDRSLRDIVRGGEHIDTMYMDGDEWVVVTEDRTETRTVGLFGRIKGGAA